MKDCEVAFDLMMRLYNDPNDLLNKMMDLLYTKYMSEISVDGRYTLTPANLAVKMVRDRIEEYVYNRTGERIVCSRRTLNKWADYHGFRTIDNMLAPLTHHIAKTRSEIKEYRRKR